MIPRETTIVAPSIGGPDTVTTFAPRMAKYCGSPPCACTPGGWRKRNPTAAKPSVSAHRWSSSKRMRIPQLQDFEGETDLSNRSEEHTSELQSHSDLVCRLLLEKKKKR